MMHCCPEELRIWWNRPSRRLKLPGVILATLLILIPVTSSYAIPKPYTQSSRVVTTRQGRVRGLIIHPSHRLLPPAEVFSGLPYASPPVGPLRFMPPTSPRAWYDSVRIADSNGPVCPQKLPLQDVNPLEYPPGRIAFLKRLDPFLRNQSEDCLYLNVYTPAAVEGRPLSSLPVIVFIHGESFEWNSGNPYDGSVLAVYGQCIVVTLNYRLGVLGFLRTSVGDSMQSNLGLLDQVAALQWVQENIGVFGGDPSNVTLMGHGTGAACVNLLLTSPVAQANKGLFRRAIMMSGSALSPWAITTSPLQYTLQVAEALNCPLNGGGAETANCLRKRRVEELLQVQNHVKAPLFRTPFGPLVDGVVIPNEPKILMDDYYELFRRYDLMYGFCEAEGAPLLGSVVALTRGIPIREREALLTSFTKNLFEERWESALVRVLTKYSAWSPQMDPGATRDAVIYALGDALVAAPVTQMGLLHSKHRSASYQYVFSHRPASREYPDDVGAVPGEELPFVFGVPLVGELGPWRRQFSPQEALLSEAIMTLWTNFARTGNPHFPKKEAFITRVDDYNRLKPNDLIWPAFHSTDWQYLDISLKPRVKAGYRREYMNFWNTELPHQLSNEPRLPPGTFRPPIHPPTTTYKPYRTTTPIYHPLPPRTTGMRDLAMQQPINNKSPSFTSKVGGAILHPITPVQQPPTTTRNLEVAKPASATLSIIIVAGLSLFVVNACACLGMVYQRRRLQTQESLLRRQFQPLLPGSPILKQQKGKLTMQAPLHERRGSTCTMDGDTKSQDDKLHHLLDVRQWVDASAMSASNSTPASETPNVTMRRPGSSLSQTSRSVRRVTLAVDATGGPQAVNPVRVDNIDDGIPRAATLPRSILKRPSTEINVTSRDDYDTRKKSTPSTMEEAVDTLRRLNCPKVLPDLPSPTSDSSSDMVFRYEPETVAVIHAPYPPKRTTARLSTFQPDDDEDISTGPSTSSNVTLPTKLPKPMTPCRRDSPPKFMTIRRTAHRAPTREQSTDTGGMSEDRPRRSWYAQYNAQTFRRPSQEESVKDENNIAEEGELTMV